GYGQSSFEEDLFDDETSFDQAGYLPVGLQAGYNLAVLPFGSLFIGAEINHAVSPFTFEVMGDVGNGQQRLLDVKINQTVIGGLVKLKFDAGVVVPFIRLGGGSYTGGSEVEYSNLLKSLVEQQTGEPLEDVETDIKSAFGFNFGAGMDYKVGSSNAVVFEFVYHMVEREADEDNSEPFKADNWAVLVGFQFGIN
ncbi:MAG: outer membrane beta-barrel protein, partial [Melioribacteraceae bacterium]|nr:outer membrane beta-barrel protein [Melioribacteraceae bacterium]